VQVVIDNKFKSVTGPVGRFIIQIVPTDIPHNITILDQDNNLEYVGDLFLTLQNDEAKELSPLKVDTNLILVKKNQTIGSNEMYSQILLDE
jgi:hypothetical protein